MSDPEYTYIKGQGWVIQTHPVVNMACGTVVRLEFRPPGPDEYWGCVNKKYKSDYHLNGEPVIEGWVEWLRKCRYESDGGMMRGGLTIPNPDSLYCTVVPV